ncbi:hypothetical protein MRX96_057940 [Rhipicephalus microplus]
MESTAKRQQAAMAVASSAKDRRTLAAKGVFALALRKYGAPPSGPKPPPCPLLLLSNIMRHGAKKTKKRRLEEEEAVSSSSRCRFPHSQPPAR